MTVKSTVSFTDQHHQFARHKVREGAYASVSSIVGAGIERIIQDEAERDAALEAMKDAIAQRMRTPRPEWIPMQDDDLFDQARERIRAKSTS